MNMANAMKPDGHHKKPKIMQLANQLGLSDSQKAELQVLEEQHKADKDALREKYNMPDRKSFRQEKRALRQSFKAEIRKILTDEQIKQLKALRKQRKLHAEPKSEHP